MSIVGGALEFEKASTLLLCNNYIDVSAPGKIGEGTAVVPSEC
jgi:hypothetical protein